MQRFDEDEELWRDASHIGKGWVIAGFASVALYFIGAIALLIHWQFR